MLETPHVIVGAALAVKFPNPLISIPLSLASHFILDMTPHWNPHLNKETNIHGKVTKSSTILVAIDSSIALISGLSIAYSSLPNFASSFNIIFSCLFSVLPDVIEAPYYFLDIRGKFMEKWIRFQKSLQVDTSPVVGLFTQVVTIVAALWWIYN